MIIIIIIVIVIIIAIVIIVVLVLVLNLVDIIHCAELRANSGTSSEQTGSFSPCNLCRYAGLRDPQTDGFPIVPQP